MSRVTVDTSYLELLNENFALKEALRKIRDLVPGSVIRLPDAHSKVSEMREIASSALAEEEKT